MTMNLLKQTGNIEIFITIQLASSSKKRVDPLLVVAVGDLDQCCHHGHHDLRPILAQVLKPNPDIMADSASTSSSITPATRIWKESLSGKIITL